MSLNDDINLGNITEALNGKIDLPNNVSQSDCHFVVESYVNGTSWYRVYDDGWCEQGGQCTSFENQYYASVTYLKEFADTNYTLLFVQKGITEDTFASNVDNFSTTTGRFRFRGGCSLIFWEAKGYIGEQS